MSCPPVKPALPSSDWSAPPLADQELAEAVSRISDLDVTRTLPGRIVWYRDVKPSRPVRAELVASLARMQGAIPEGIVAVWEAPGPDGGWLGKHRDGRIVDLVLDPGGRCFKLKEPA